MKKCYIAGKIGDLSEEVWKRNFEQAKQEVREMGMEPISPTDLPHEHGHSWSEYMREDLIALLQCECLYAQRNWRHSPGAEIEIQLALSVGIHIIHQPCMGLPVPAESINESHAA